VAPLKHSSRLPPVPAIFAAEVEMRFSALLLGSASLLAAADIAAAADLPIAEPVQYVRICDAFGAGFFYIAGTDTCLRISGYVRAETHWVDGDTELLRPGGTNSEFNNFTTRARAKVMFDAQTSTDIGTIRAYVEFEGTRGPQDYPGTYPDEFSIPATFIEVTSDVGIFTAGAAGSFFDFYSSDDYGTRIDIDDNTTEQTLFAYSIVGPNGLKGTLSIEDPDSGGRRLDGADDYEGLELPDLIGSVRVDQGWGSAQAMGMVRQIHDVNGDGLGWAVGGGFNLLLPIHNISFGTQFGYADGALGYITTDPGGIGDFSGPDGDDTNQAWMARAGLLVPVTDKLSTWFDGSFTHAEDDAVDEYDYWTFVAGASWAPNDNLYMGPEFGYNNLDGDDPGEDGELWGVMWRVESSF